MSQLVDPALRGVPRAIAYTLPAEAPIHVTRFEWRDASRHRDVPVTIYAPAVTNQPLPLVVFSHGIGEDRDSYAYLGRAWAAHGFIAVHVTHAGTDKAMLRTGYWNLYRATKKAENWKARVDDVRFVIDQMLRGAAAPLRVDATRIALAGHSAGALTALVPDDTRVKTVIAISMPKVSGVPYRTDVPVLHMTGTCDGSLIYRTRPRDRRVPFLQSTSRDQVLVTIEGAHHETFSNVADPLHPLIAEITTAWLLATLDHDEAARAFLLDGGLSARARVVVERK